MLAYSHWNRLQIARRTVTSATRLIAFSSMPPAWYTVRIEVSTQFLA
jgi:hypothetical protein